MGKVFILLSPEILFFSSRYHQSCFISSPGPMGLVLFIARTLVCNKNKSPFVIILLAYNRQFIKTKISWVAVSYIVEKALANYKRMILEWPCINYTQHIFVKFVLYLQRH